MKRAQNLKTTPTFFWNYLVTSKQLGYFFKFLWPSENIWTLTKDRKYHSHYPFSFDSFDLESSFSDIFLIYSEHYYSLASPSWGNSVKVLQGKNIGYFSLQNMTWNAVVTLSNFVIRFFWFGEFLFTWILNILMLKNLPSCGNAVRIRVIQGEKIGIFSRRIWRVAQ